MQETPIWKLFLIVAVLALCGLSLYPPSQRLKPGLDLAGGTTLVYQVDVPGNQDARIVIDQVIETLKKRVDPNGVRNLVWRRQAGNRIEIQVPLPPKETTQRRSDYLRLQDELTAGNLKARQIDAALRVERSQRGNVLARLAGGNQPRLDRLEVLAVAYDAREALRGPYETAQKQRSEFEKALKQLSADASASERSDLERQLNDAQADLIAKTRRFVDARQAVDQARQAVLATNIDPARLDQILSLPDQPRQAGDGEVSDEALSERAQALETLIAAHPDRSETIRGIAQAKALYDAVRGPLDDPNDLIALLRGSGVLEFRIAPEPGLPAAQEYRDRLTKRGPKAGRRKPHRWMVVDDLTSFIDRPSDRKELEEDPERYFSERGLIGQLHGGEYYILLGNADGSSMTQAQRGWELSKAYPQMDDSGLPCVGFQLNRVGGQLMSNLTGSNRGKPMAIVLDERVISTPRINDRIHDQGIITGGRGGFDSEEQSYLIRTLNAGSLQGRLSQDPIYIKKFGPQLGQDNLRSGLEAAVWALGLVAGFMAVYYLLGGLVADFALAANMVIILGTMALFGATFTLPGIAGIVLTIGMAVDANVLIFERIREELENKADVRTAVRLGYDKAFSTIIDANLTTLITCVILNYTATAEIKGFAITLMVGILATMFTALFCTRVIVSVYLNLVNPKSIVMLPTVVGGVRRLLSPKANWTTKRPLFFGLSAVLIVLGLVVITQRGQELLDIEFRSGTQVSFELGQGHTLSLAQARQRLDEAAEQFDLPHLAGQRASVVTVGEVQGDQARELSVATLETDPAAVSEAIKSAFADVLDVQRPIDFAGMGSGHEAPPVSEAPTYAVRRANLGQCINRPQIQDDVTEYLGGVAVVVDQMDPAPTLDELTQRVDRMRLQPSYEALGYRQTTVIGLDLDPTAADGDPRYRSAVVLATEEGINYVDSPEAFSEVGGLADTQWRLVRDALRRDTSLGSVANFSSQISNTMKQQAIVALVLSILAVVAYIWFRFGSLRYGLAAIVALVHDVTVALGLVALAGLVYDTPVGQALMLSDFKINLALVAAMLTIVGYSLNDTIVVFDRIRENRGRLAFATEGIVNDSINQTISRTVMTSVTTLIALMTLYLFGGDGVHGFAFAMIIGVLVGTYSSIAIAAPVVLMLGGGRATQGQDAKNSAKGAVTA